MNEKDTNEILNTEEIDEQNAPLDANTESNEDEINLFGESEADANEESADAQEYDTEEAATEESVDSSSEDVDIESPDDNNDDAANDTEEAADTDSHEATEDVANHEASAKEKKTEEKVRRIDSIFDFVELFVFTLAAVFIITSFFFKYSIVEGPSMMNTLHHGDRLILSSFMYEPECGDVVVVHSEALDKVIVKRIIATEGQTVRITKTDVYVDGKKLIEPYVYTEDYTGLVYHYDIPENQEYVEVVVPEGEIYVMGDHRNNSDDSRDRGTIKEDAIIGKVIYRFLPFDDAGKIESIRITED